MEEKPAALRHLNTLNKKVLKQYETLQKRQRTPLDEAAYYAGQLRAKSIRSLTALASELGVPRQRVFKHMRLLGLPEPIQRFLAAQRTPEILRYFSVRRLQTLVRLDPRTAWRRFQAMVQEARQEAGIWAAPSPEEGPGR